MTTARPSRRAALGIAAAAATLPFLPARLSWAAPEAAHQPAKPGITPDKALAMLREGNERFVTDAPYRAEIGRDRRLALAREQHPFAVLVGCSDSRVPPEILFGRGLGELFIVRTAGNTVDTAGLGSIEYAVAHLGVPLVVVLGHERCGAVAAAVELVTKGAEPADAIGRMVEPIVPAVLRAQRAAGGRDLVDAAVRANVQRVVEQLRIAGPMLIDPVKAGTLKVVGARYDLDDGKVEFMEG